MVGISLKGITRVIEHNTLRSFRSFQHVPVPAVLSGRKVSVFHVLPSVPGTTWIEVVGGSLSDKDSDL